MSVVDVVGQRFGRLTVVCRSERKSTAGALWLCKCDCGGATTTTSLKLRNGHTKSCGCLKREVIEQGANLSHGMANKTSTYRTWKEMRQRCTNPNSDKWKWYGGRGISICNEWDDYKTFLRDMGERPVGTTLDRINPDDGYHAKNCRWATPKQQAETNRGVFVKGMVPWNKGGTKKIGTTK